MSQVQPVEPKNDIGVFRGRRSELMLGFGALGASGSDFVGGTGLWRLLVIVVSIIPIVTYVLASCDGSLFALLAITVGGLLICGIRGSCVLWNSHATTSNASLRNSESHDECKAA